MPFVIVMGRAMWKGWDGVEMGMGMAAAKSRTGQGIFSPTPPGKFE
jgi:hypothetical protein